jgi:isoquinoline 1-oxidoreductase alpha subunit
LSIGRSDFAAVAGGKARGRRSRISDGRAYAAHLRIFIATGTIYGCRPRADRRQLSTSASHARQPFRPFSRATEREQTMPTLIINGQSHNVDVEPDTPLLWVLRDTLGMTGTKYGCGIAQCGACTVHVNGVATRSCSVPLSAVAGAQITIIEGLAANGVLHKVQQAWLDNDVPQCGYCQSGMIMAVAELLKTKPKPTDADIDSAITNICRCGTYQQVRTAIHAAANA